MSDSFLANSFFFHLIAWGNSSRFWTDEALAKGLIELRHYRVSRKLVQNFWNGVYVVKQQSCSKLVTNGKNLNFIKFGEIHTFLSNSSSKVSKEFALFDTRKTLPVKKEKKKRVSRISIDPKNILSPELGWIPLNGVFHFLFPRAYIPLLYRSMFQFPRSIENYDDMEPDFSPVGTIIGNCIRNFNNQKLYHDRITIRTTLRIISDISQVINLDWLVVTLITFKYFRWKVYAS